VHGEDDESLLAVVAAFLVGADEVVVARVAEHEAGVAVREAEQGLGGVACVVAVLGHLQHGVRVLVVFELCVHRAHGTTRHAYAFLAGYAKHTDRKHTRLTESVVDMETLALGPVVERLGREFHPTAVTADHELAPRAAARRYQGHQEQEKSGRHERRSRHGLDRLALVTNNLPRPEYPEHDLASDYLRVLISSYR
jgi:hypothetical protein